mgnify:CR=1 FL=1|jgi:poly-gamma-glutamate capsule biosynthesis protein CapA/YwtB (metallophosphatase superfamily)
MKKNQSFLVIAIVLGIGLLLGLGFAWAGLTGSAPKQPSLPQAEAGRQETGPETGPNAPTPSEPEYVDITIASVGDILIHNTLYFAAYDAATQAYDFNDQFKYVKKLLKEADLTIANLETSLGGPEVGYSSYPKFNTPDTIVDALKDSGVDILTAANNHRMDTGLAGFFRTIDVVRAKGLDIVGVRADEAEKTYALKEIKGVKVAVLNFGYAYPLADGGLSINGLPLPAEKTKLMDTFNPQDIGQATDVLARRIAEAQNDGAEILIVCLHWGDEYHRLPNNFQKELAQNLVELGVDAIFGGHPHVLQPAVYLSSAEGRQVPVFYSQGNFISDQRQETVNNIYTEQGIVAKVTFRVEINNSKNQEELIKNNEIISKKPMVLNAEAIPTWVNKKIIANKFYYEVIPVEQALAAQADPDFSEKYPLLNAADLERIEFCLKTVEELAQGLALP